VSILATAIDNTKNGRFLRALGPGWIWGMELLMLAGSARLFGRTDRATYVAKYFVIIPSALLGISLLSISISDLLIDLSVPTAMMLAYFTIAGIYETQSRAYAAGTGVFAPAPIERSTGTLQVACLPATVPRAELDPVLIRPGCPIKLWLPPKAGFGVDWTAQGWILWRWRLPGTPEDAAEARPDLRWHDVPAPPAAGHFALAAAITAAVRADDSQRG
jgi:hypothetical protein